MNANTGMAWQPILFGDDILILSYPFVCNFQRLSFLKASYEYWQDLFRADHGVRSMDKIFPNRGAQ